jgi:hypothetical protein
MIDAAWLAYVGPAAGVVGMATGIAGMVTSIANYRRVSRMKALDLRLALRDEAGATRETIDGLPELIGRADASRTAVLAPRGAVNSGAHVLWQRERDADLARVETVRAELPSAGETFDTVSPDELESKLVAIRALNRKATGLRDKYKDALAADDKTREQIAAQAITMAAARMKGSG